MKTKKPQKTGLALPPGVSLPEGVLESDLRGPGYDPRRKRSDYEDYAKTSYETGALLPADPPKGERTYGDTASFELWYTQRFGWVIPTLTIKSARRLEAFGGTRRTYAVAVKDGKTVTCGMGPHVLKTLKVYAKLTRVEALRRYFDLRVAGAASAGDIRDRISTRRAQTVGRRRGDFW